MVWEMTSVQLDKMYGVIFIIVMGDKITYGRDGLALL